MTENRSMKDHYRSPEEVGISLKAAGINDLNLIKEFLSRPEIDSLFTPALSDPVRGITIDERVDRKFKQGVWMVAIHDGAVIGCMAVVPNKVPLDVPRPDSSKGIDISEGISLREWDVEKIMELSTVVTDPRIKKALMVRGVGTGLLEMAKEWVKSEGNGKWGLITDSWVGGDMEGFIATINTRKYQAWLGKNKQPSNLGKGHFFDTLARIYSDPGKRGKEGPPTVIYGIPISDNDWNFFLSKQKEIENLRNLYK